ncbi:MAG: exopolysaccharide biosynthesis protein [Puniceicoccales bacterium]|jgi:hypothetical protein|nr:exopolysaccharide biosynthesis protein [Puniceicoccales bacterium]
MKVPLDETPLSVAPAEKRESIGAIVSRLAVECRERDVTLGGLVERLEGRSSLLLVFLLALPFCQPVPLAGFSTVMGAPLAFLGWRLMIGGELRLPRRYEGAIVPKKLFPVLLGGAGRLLRWMERHLKEQWGNLLAPAWVARVCGANIFVCALLLALPGFIPCSNFFPAFAIALTAAALLESDGKMLVRAAVASVINLLFWGTWGVLIWLYGWAVVKKTVTWVQSLVCAG